MTATNDMALVQLDAALSKPEAGKRPTRWERTKKRRKTGDEFMEGRFGDEDDKPYRPLPFLDVPPGLTPTDMDQFFREQRLEELQKKLLKGELETAAADVRPKSPPPTYDRNGARTNTLDMRVRKAMMDEHQRLVEFFALNPEHFQWFRPPVDFKPSKKVMRIIIPSDKFPEYNFMGLIIGPRGCNHKRLEAESGAQISIRGKGTLKEGKKTDHQSEEESSMPQHIHITADDDEKLMKACRLIEPLLDPTHPQHEEFKKKGLEQLAIVNGTGSTLMKHEQRCTLCGAVGHYSWECPDAQFQSFKKAEVQCAFCGDRGHVTTDCKLVKEKKLNSQQLDELEERQRRAHEHRERRLNDTYSAPAPGQSVQIDHEYEKMMADLFGGNTSFNPGITTGSPDAKAATSSAASGAVGGSSPHRPPPPPPGAPPSGAAGNQRFGVGYQQQQQQQAQQPQQHGAYQGFGGSSSGQQQPQQQMMMGYGQPPWGMGMQHYQMQQWNQVQQWQQWQQMQQGMQGMVGAYNAAGQWAPMNATNANAVAMGSRVSAENQSESPSPATTKGWGP